MRLSKKKAEKEDQNGEALTSRAAVSERDVGHGPGF